MRMLLTIALCMVATNVWAAELPSEFQGKWGSSNQECSEHPLIVTAKPAEEESDNFGKQPEILSVKTVKSESSFSNTNETEITLVVSVQGSTTKTLYTYREAWAIRNIRGHTFLLVAYLGEVPPRKNDRAPTLSILQRCDEH